MLKPESTDLLGHFIQSAETLGVKVEVIEKNADQLCASLQRATVGEEQVLLSKPDFLAPELFKTFLSDRRVIIAPTKEQLSTIATGVTDVFCAIASTGSVCVPVSNNLSSPASVLTRKHIAVLDAETIVPRPRDVFSDDYPWMKKFTRSFSFITGPSATADMGPLVIGVHGPGEVQVIVII